MEHTWHHLQADLDLEILAETRKQAHQAVQNVSAVGRCFLGVLDSDENANLEWVPELQRLAGRWIDGNIVFRSSLDFTNFAVHLVNEKLESISSVEVNGKRQGIVMVWLEEQISTLGFNSSDITLDLPYEIPEYPQAKKKPFDVDMIYIHELGKYFNNAHYVLSQFKQEVSGFGPVKSWPHHFDMSCMDIIKDTGNPETTATLNIGMSPGDETFNEPYFFVTPWPYPDEDELKPIKRGQWYFENWAGAILKASDILYLPEKEQYLTA